MMESDRISIDRITWARWRRAVGACVTSHPPARDTQSVAVPLREIRMGAAPCFAVLDSPATLPSASAAARRLGLLAPRIITVVTFAPDDTLANHHDLRPMPGR